TGYSSFSYLKRFPINALKIDRCFIRDVTSDPYDSAIVVTIAALAQSLNLEVIAEGVETNEQLEVLRANRCNEFQGNLISKPVPAREFEALLEEEEQLSVRRRLAAHNAPEAAQNIVT
ncbi:MAG: EAL domain-containing protein, partial [Acidiferrobacterales bacterium]